MSPTSRLLAVGLFLSGAALGLGAHDVSLFDPDPLKDILAPGEALFLPPLMGTAPEALLLGTALEISGQLAYFSYNRGILVLEEDGRASEKTLIRFFLDSLEGNPFSTAPVQAREKSPDGPGGAELSRPFLGGTLYFSRLKPGEVRLITDKKEVISLGDSPGIHTTHFETAKEIFWLGDGSQYYGYNREGRIQAEYNLDSLSSLKRKRALSAAVFPSGRLFLVLEQGEILFMGPETSLGLNRYSTDLADLFIEYYRTGFEYIEQYRPELVHEYREWAARSVYALFRRDPLNPHLTALYKDLE